MTKQQGNSRTSVVLGITFFVVAIGLFAAAFYYFDGMSLVDSILDGDTPVATDDSSEPDETPISTEPDEPTLTLPTGMSESFALRVWQEQIDSQSNISRLINGEITSIEITSTVIDGDSAELGIVVEGSDGPSVQGVIGMSQFDGKWYFNYVHEIKSTLAAEPDGTELPGVEDVDVELLNTIISEQAASSEVLEEYATGVVSRVDVVDIVEGPDTITLKLEMTETHEQGSGEVVLISRTLDGKQYWFIARFTKTVSE